jgi:hypothetical protein
VDKVTSRKEFLLCAAPVPSGQGAMPPNLNLEQVENDKTRTWPPENATPITATVRGAFKN